MWNLGFPGGSMVKNPPANAGGLGSIPDPGRPHIPAGQLSPCAITTEPVPRNPGTTAAEPRCCSCWKSSTLEAVRRKRSLCNEKLVHPTREQPPLTETREKPMQQQRPRIVRQIEFFF